MAKQTRRDFLKTASFIGLTAAGISSTAKAEEKFELSEDRIGVLVDSTKCIGCRSCEWACKNEHNLPNLPLEEFQNDRSVFEKDLNKLKELKEKLRTGKEEKYHETEFVEIGEMEKLDNNAWQRFIEEFFA